MAMGKGIYCLGAESDTGRIVGKKQQFIPIGSDDLLHGGKKEGVIEDEIIGKSWNGAGKESDVAEKVKDMADDDDSIGLVTEMRRAVRRYPIMPAGVEEFEAAVIIGE